MKAQLSAFYALTGRSPAGLSPASCSEFTGTIKNRGGGSRPLD